MELRLAVVQPETLTGADAPKNVDRAVAYIRQAARDGARLVALPETYPGPYTVPIFKQWLRPEVYGGIARGTGR
jgi:predicted amidohydrolase